MNNTTPNTSPRAPKKELTPEPEYKAQDLLDDRKKEKNEARAKKMARRMKLNGG